MELSTRVSAPPDRPGAETAGPQSVSAQGEGPPQFAICAKNFARAHFGEQEPKEVGFSSDFERAADDGS
jgi:hypothetical protein